MNLAEAIQILKSESCSDCSYSCETVLNCDNSYCDYKRAVTIAIDLMQKILDGINMRGEV